MPKLFSMKGVESKWFTFREPDGEFFRLKLKYPTYKEKKINLVEVDENTEQIFTRMKNLISVILTDWEGFKDASGNELKFSDKILDDPVSLESFLSIMVMKKNDEGKDKESALSALIFDLIQSPSRFFDHESF